MGCRPDAKIRCGMDTPFIILAGVGLFLIVGWLHDRKRADDVRELANRCGFAYIGAAFPRSLTLHGTPFERVSSIWNVIDGQCHGIRVVAFDCRIGSGKGSWSRTAIAVQTPRDISRIRKFSGDLAVDRSGEWAVMYQPRTFSLIPLGLTPVRELEARLGSISN